NFVFGT
nr:Chain A, NFVFGT Immunoglobulin Light-Chain Variable Domain [Homo sapiens]6DIX_B Chain B, NFVFGT Immunoglobulin Light-Chain Variable Domain [Homo sapiens]6DIX_C Chain C, NFVFGT Immunoglobulin Light-Chain Variable Domain [Homo sapiens]6DIX_D Chain D, NFVFGT Immunoglobulin Light-Chain Variable Domain [Homo sapiens]